MNQNGAFKPAGSCYLITAAIAGSVPAPIQIDGPTGREISLLVINDGNAKVFLAYGETSAKATANAVIPTVGSPSPGVIPIHNSIPHVLTMAPGLWYTAIVATGTEPLYLVSGDGKW